MNRLHNVRSNPLRVASLFFVALILIISLTLLELHGGRGGNTDLQRQVLSIASQLRAPGDQNTLTAATSTFPAAMHMRYEVQEELLQGKTSNEVIHDMVAEYGKEVYAAPPIIGFGVWVWIVPAMALSLMLYIAVFSLSRRRQVRQLAETSDGKGSSTIFDIGREKVDARLRDYL